MESEDELIGGSGLDELQQQLQQKLDSMLEDRIGPAKKRKSGELRHKKRKSKDRSSHHEETRLCTTVSHVNPPKTTSEPSRNTVTILKKIQDLTSAAKREKERSTSAKLIKERHVIQAKIRTSCDLKLEQTEESDDSSDSEISELGNGSDCLSPEEELDSQMFDSDDSSAEGDFEESKLGHGSGKQRENRQMEKFKKALGITDADLQRARDKQQQINQDRGQTNKQVKTLGLLKGSRKRVKPEIVVFEDPAKRNKLESNTGRKKSKPEGPPTEDGHSDDNPAFDLQRARFEVRKFGIKGLQGENKEKGMIDLLVSLGAKPPKKGSVNYKELQTQRKQEQLEEIQKKNMDRKLGFRVVGSKNKRRGRDKNGGVDGQIGTYRSGVQVVGKKAIDKVNRKPSRRR